MGIYLLQCPWVLQKNPALKVANQKVRYVLVTSISPKINRYVIATEKIFCNDYDYDFDYDLYSGKTLFNLTTKFDRCRRHI